MEWQFADDPITATQLERIEAVLGVRFPPDFAECFCANNGASPSLDTFRTSVGTERVFGTLLSADEDSDEYILAVVADYRGSLPVGVVPFAFDPGGNLICFDDGMDPDHPAVVFWDHEQGAQSRPVPVASQFTELIASLR